MQDQIPKEWLCPMTQELMMDPVIADDGFSYERRSLKDWFLKSQTSPMTGAELASKNMISNHALRQTIQSYCEKKGIVLSEPHIPIHQQKIDLPSRHSNLTCDIDTILDKKQNGLYYVQLKINPPQEPDIKRKPCSMICIVDVSESMDTDAVLGGKNIESHGFSRLDLVKHSLNTIVQFMGPQDQIALITFNNSGKLFMPLTQSSITGKIFINNRIKQLKASGSTNIWDGLKIALELYKEKSQRSQKNTFISLLTDGQPNFNPPRGITPTLRKFIQINQMNTPNIHVFGYGYELDSHLLREIAQIGYGTYTYIPDCSMVGTAFINFMATSLSTYTNNLSLQLQIGRNVDFRGAIGFRREKDGSYNLGLIQYGQPRIIILEFGSRSLMGGLDNLGRFQISYGEFYQNKLTNILPISYHSGDQEEMNRNLHRINYIKLLEKLTEANLSNRGQCWMLINELYQDMSFKHQQSPSATTLCLLKQLKNDESEKEGQVAKSFEKEEWYNKWGKHYILSLHLAHTMQICTNFKDPGLQLYAGAQFEKNRANLDTLFIKMPPPEPSAKKLKNIVYAPAPIHMGDYYNQWGGCIYSENFVELSTGQKVKVKSLRKGDQIKTRDNKIVKLECLVETNIFNYVDMVKIGQLLITLYHPVFYKSRWCFPKELIEEPGIEIVNVFVESYYNVVLESKGVSIVCEGIQCISLGHGVEEPVAQHEYLGSQRVKQDLKKHKKGYEKGFVRVKETKRNPSTKKIEGFIVDF